MGGDPQPRAADREGRTTAFCENPACRSGALRLAEIYGEVIDELAYTELED